MINIRSIRQIGLILVIVTCSACSGQANQSPKAQTPTPVRTAVPLTQTKPETAHGIGRLEAEQESTLSFRTGGVVDTVLVDIGDRVHRGQVLARLQSVDLSAVVTRTAQQRALAAREVQRMTTLAADQLVARKMLDDAKTALNTADADLSAAQFAIGHTTILAAADGVVLQRQAEPGETVAAGQAIVRLSGEDAHWLLRVEMTDRDAVRLHVGAAAEVQIDAFPSLRLPAQVTRIGGQANHDSGAVSVELTLKALGQPLKSGLIARAEITLSLQDGLAVPVDALTQANGDRGELIVVQNGRAHRQPVQLGKISGGDVAVTSGLRADARVVVEGAAYVDDGQAVADAVATRAR